jgi:cysteinyl-tRNA synthetase
MKKAIDLFKEKFINSMEDDINTADSVSALFELIKWANTNLNENSLKNVVQYAYSTLMELTNILGILSKKDEMLDNDITELIEKRTEARRNKDFKLADKIRDELKEKGIILEDTSEGVKWKRV